MERDRTGWSDGEILWQPRPDARETTRVGEYMRWLERERSLSFADYRELWTWSVTDIESFWASIWDYFGVRSDTPRGEVLPERVMPGADWFPGVSINYARHLIEQARQRPDDVAVVASSQTREAVELTFGELEAQVARARTGLQRLGVTSGDRVVAYLPNIPEALVAFLATASLGAIWSSCAPEFGYRSVVDRFAQVEPKVLLAVAGYRFGDKDIDCRPRVAAIVEALPTVDHVVHVPYGPNSLDALESTGDVTGWDALLADTSPLVFEPVPFRHPLCILFSSGTTGLPKAIVHGHGGILLEHLKNHVLSWDLGPGDRLFWFTTTAWMMWNALVSSLLTGASIVMLDGNPMHPDLENQWRLAEQTGATMMGLSPAFIMACRKAGLTPAESFDLSRLRTLCAAGSPLPGEGFVWLAEQFGDDAPLNVGSGGTDVCSGLLQGNPMLPVYVGEISGQCLGVSSQCFDADGRSVVGELGELVLTEPMPSMPVGFWGDDDGSRYAATYFDQYPGVFRFGDWVRLTEHGSSVVTGRSDATLNRGGVRLGTAELYRVVEEFDRVEDSLVVHLEDPEGGNGELVLFLALSDGDLDDAFKTDVLRSLREALSPRHVPDTVVQMPGVPRNMTGKKLELPVKKIMQGATPESVVSSGAMSNPEVLTAYLDYAASRP
jgi:acetoacetyl-CoA synthetase